MSRTARERDGRRPVIGICARPNESGDKTYIAEDYAHRVAVAGGIPVGLPYGEGAASMAAELVDRIDGLVLTGGGDVSPDGFGGHPYVEWSKAPIDGLLPCRDAFEAALVDSAWALDLPTLGICRGVQVMNVSRGGTLVRDVSELNNPMTLAHYMERPFDRPVHRLFIERGSRLAAILGTTEMEVNSIHHQAIAQPAPEGRVVAHAEDGTPEALEFDEKTFFIGVQWHPEILGTTPQLFQALVDAAAAGMTWRPSGQRAAALESA